MAQAITTLISLTGVVSNGTFNSPAYQTTSLDQTNPRFPRLIQLTDAGVKISSTGTTIGIPLSEITKMAATKFPALTWPPVITTQPASGSVFHPAAFAFNVVATSELTSISYQWQLSLNGGSSFTVLTDSGGQQTGSATSSLSIVNSTGSNGNVYRCVTYNASGTAISSQATLTVG